jgi:gliding motility-associated lipoprotein GldK
MKKIFLFLLILALFNSCRSGDKGELVGVEGKKWHPEKPYGMSLVPGGAFIMGKSDDDVVSIQDAPTKTVSVRSFYMDETEITNSEYREFVFWVRDSILRRELAERAEEEGLTIDDEDTIGEYAFYTSEEEDLTPYEQYMIDTYGDEQRRVNNNIDLIFDQEDYPDVLYAEIMDGMFLPLSESYNGQRTWDVSKFEFEYSEMQFIQVSESPKEIMKFINKQAVSVYPDTTVWIKDFEYSYNEPMHNDYFWHEAYSDYPVVGITWQQAKAFCQWRTLKKNIYRKERKKEFVNSFRLPSEAEWEYAARGGLEGATFPWGGPYAKNDRGCFLANFKPLRGNYAADQALYTVEADAYEPNEYNLFNMAGNVSEWTSSTYERDSYEFSSSINPSVSDNENNEDGLKVVRGGSWKDVSYYLQVSTRDFEKANVPRSYIGFRTVQDYLGTDVTANAATN